MLHNRQSDLWCNSPNCISCCSYDQLGCRKPSQSFSECLNANARGVLSRPQYLVSALCKQVELDGTTQPSSRTLGAIEQTLASVATTIKHATLGGESSAPVNSQDRGPLAWHGDGASGQAWSWIKWQLPLQVCNSMNHGRQYEPGSCCTYVSATSCALPTMEMHTVQQ